MQGQACQGFVQSLEERGRGACPLLCVSHRVRRAHIAHHISDLPWLQLLADGITGWPGKGSPTQPRTGAEGASPRRAPFPPGPSPSPPLPPLPPPPPRRSCRPHSGDTGSSGGPLPPHFPSARDARDARRQDRADCGGEERGSRAGGVGSGRWSGTHAGGRWLVQRVSSMLTLDPRPLPVPLLQPPPLVPG